MDDRGFEDGTGWLLIMGAYKLDEELEDDEELEQRWDELGAAAAAEELVLGDDRVLLDLDQGVTNVE